jgi:hypothetical protein
VTLTRADSGVPTRPPRIPERAADRRAQSAGAGNCSACRRSRCPPSARCAAREGGTETVVPGQFSSAGIEARLDRLAKLITKGLDSNAQQIAQGSQAGINGATSTAHLQRVVRDRLAPDGDVLDLARPVVIHEPSDRRRVADRGELALMRRAQPIGAASVDDRAAFDQTARTITHGAQSASLRAGGSAHAITLGMGDTPARIDSEPTLLPYCHRVGLVDLETTRDQPVAPVLEDGRSPGRPVGTAHAPNMPARRGCAQGAGRPGPVGVSPQEETRATRGGQPSVKPIPRLPALPTSNRATNAQSTLCGLLSM